MPTNKPSIFSLLLSVLSSKHSGMRHCPTHSLAIEEISSKQPFGFHQRTLVTGSVTLPSPVAGENVTVYSLRREVGGKIRAKVQDLLEESTDQD